MISVYYSPLDTASTPKERQAKQNSEQSCLTDGPSNMKSRRKRYIEVLHRKWIVEIVLTQISRKLGQIERSKEFKLFRSGESIQRYDIDFVRLIWYFL